jgi:hypothetical protein
MRCRLPFLISALALTATQATAGVVATSTQTELDSKQVSPSMAYVDADRFKIVNPDNIMIFRGDLNRAWVIDPQKRTYSEMTAETLQRMAGQMSGAMAAAQAQMQAELAKMPPEQRAQLEAMLAGRGGLAGLSGQPARAPQVSYAKTGASKSVGSWRCDVYSKNVDGRKDEDLCIAPIAAAGLSAADFQIFERFSTFMAPIMSSSVVPQDDVLRWSAMNKAIGFQGMPLDTVTYSGGRPDRQMTVNKLERTSIPASTYELPAGLTRQEIPSLGTPGGRAPR